MIRIDRKDFEQSPGEYLQKVRAGETLVITQEAAPIAELHPVAASAPAAQKRMLGFGAGKAEILPAFWDPLPDDELALWNGEE
jgi:antitoxin (DNA-binding transcriptional repressor) of toxin-antitoxin stability system